ncbi:hypothetical protein [Variovorax sp. V15]|uniref:hypothetical protein n=1 Tax=Variovorax sp. V15 TaxID=3065952 RepID=UPI0034E8AE96
MIKRSFPDVRVALHGDCNAKVVLVELGIERGLRQARDDRVHRRSAFEQRFQQSRGVLFPQALVPVARDSMTVFRRAPSPTDSQIF